MQVFRHFYFGLFLHSYSRLCTEIEKDNVKKAQKTAIESYLREKGKSNYGRQKLPYPSNWEQDYALWKNGEITATEFMRRSGLKKGTFYNMIKEYKSENPETISKRAQIQENRF